MRHALIFSALALLLLHTPAEAAAASAGNAAVALSDNARAPQRARHSAPRVRKQPARKKIKVACIGNSITFGSGTARPDSDSYPAQLQRLLGDGYEVGRFGKPGATLLRKAFRPYFDQEEYRQAKDFQADIAIIHLGVNDTDPRAWPNYGDDFVGDYLALIDSLRAASPGCRFYVARTTPLSHRHQRFESGTRDWQKAVNRAIDVVCEVSGATLIDFHEPLYAHPHLIPDAIHPNEAGAGIMARTACRLLTGNYGGLAMSPLYSDDMILPHGRTFRIEGRADAGERVTVGIGGQQHEAVTDIYGRWSVCLDPLRAGEGYTLHVSTPKRRLTYRNVAAGEIWLCSGQSNMAFTLSQSATAQQDQAEAGRPGLRLYDMKARWETDNCEWTPEALDSVNAGLYYAPATWTRCTPESAARFSAVGYHFGRALSDSLGMPVGLICNAIGGSPTEAWVSRRLLEAEFPAILRDWMTNDFVQDWVRGRAQRNTARRSLSLQRHPYEPCYLYETGIRSLEHFPIEGVIWYQGESNAHNIEAHEHLFGLMVRSLRDYWACDTLPVYFVQLSSLGRPSWPAFRESQRRLALSLPHTGMAVSSDAGHPTDVHPRDKAPVGRRLALLALHDHYGRSQTEARGPEPLAAECCDGEIRIRFAHAAALRTSDGQPPRTFETAGHEGLFRTADARIEGDCVVLRSPEGLTNVRFVRYGWQPYTTANLTGATGLPCSTFRIDVSPAGAPARQKPE